MADNSTAPPLSKESKQKRSKFASIVSGSTSGAIVSACVQPLDVLRTRMQAEAAKGNFLSTMQTLRTVHLEVRHALMLAGFD
jgi:solute carrier family 25 protein 38